MHNSQFNANSDFETLRSALHGRRVLVEMREGRRWHHRDIAECRVSQPGTSEAPLVELVLPQPYPAAQLALGSHVLRVPPGRFSHFQPTTGAADYHFVSVLYDNDDVDESSRVADRPFVIVTSEPINDSNVTSSETS
jgi:hypothetical protein